MYHIHIEELKKWSTKLSIQTHTHTHKIWRVPNPVGKYRSQSIRLAATTVCLVILLWTNELTNNLTYFQKSDKGLSHGGISIFLTLALWAS